MSPPWPLMLPWPFPPPAASAPLAVETVKAAAMRIPATIDRLIGSTSLSARLRRNVRRRQHLTGVRSTGDHDERLALQSNANQAHVRHPADRHEKSPKLRCPGVEAPDHDGEDTGPPCL